MGNSVSYCEAAAVEVEVEEPAVEEEVAAEDSTPEIVVKTAPHDPRFPATNQARHCYTNYNMYYKCIKQNEGDEEKCAGYARAYRSICPAEWIEKWNEQREEGKWPGKY